MVFGDGKPLIGGLTTQKFINMTDVMHFAIGVGDGAQVIFVGIWCVHNDNFVKKDDLL